MNKVFTVEQTTHDDRGKEVKTAIPIENGRWICFAGTSWYSPEPTYDEYGESSDFDSHTESRYEAVGPKPAQRIRLNFSHSRSRYTSCGSSFYVLVGDEPFGIISTFLENGKMVGGMSFTCARQVHKGELGRRPLIARPRFVREAPPCTEERESMFTGKPVKKRDLRRGKFGWARVVDVANLVNMPPLAMLHQYFLFTHTEHPALQAIISTNESDIHTDAYSRIVYLNEQQIDDVSPDSLWIRKGFAMVILHLHHLGYTGSQK